jgi:signal recognition particle receptor subunit beta
VAVYDPESQKLVVRVVYDGPGMAGKTTNLQQLYSIFAPQRRSELYTGTTADSRTLCLDWMQIDGGLVRGHDLRCHLLTVPGQEVLARRRQMLLSMADTVVFVLESSEAGLEDALPMWRSLLAWTGGPEQGVPIVIQANKQDLPGALNARQIRERWTLDPAILVSAASASSGEGVRETAVLAIRGAAMLLQELLANANLDELKGTYQSGQELERSILAAERNGVTLGESPRQPLSLAAAAALSESPAAPDSIDPSVMASEWTGEITLPSVDAPAGLVWPALDGRKTLRRVPFLEATRHDAPVSHADPGHRRAEPIVYEAGIWCLRTSLARRFADSEQAREALVRLAHRKLALGTLCVPRTALVAQRSADHAYWLWTVSLWLSPLSSQLEYAVKSCDEGTLSEALSHYARLIIRALRLCLDSNVVLNLHPRNFGVLYDQGFYLEDELGSGSKNPNVGRSILRRVDEYAGYPGALRVYTEVLLHELNTQLQPAELEQLGLGHALEETIVTTDAGKRGKAQLLLELSSRQAVTASERRSGVNET